MLKKVLIGLGVMSIGLVLSACSTSTSGTTISGLPDLFSYMPGDFDQLLYIDVDQELLELVATQYGAATPIADEFQNIDALGIRQSGQEEDGVNLLFVQGDEVNIDQLAALGLVALDPSYQALSITDTIQVYGDGTLIESIEYVGMEADALMQEFATLYKKDPGNFSFISRPNLSGLQGLAVQFSTKLLGTVGTLSIGNILPTGEARMLFKEGIVPEGRESRTARTANDASPVHIAMSGITELLGLDKTLVKTFLPIILTQYLGDGASLLTDENYDVLLQGLAGSVSLDLIPSLIGMGGRLVIEDPTVYSVFNNMFPVLDGAVKTQMFSGAQIETVKEASSISRNTELPIGSGELLGFPLLSIDQGADTTSISLLMIDDLPLSQTKETYPGDTIASASVDFDLLTSMMGVEPGEILQDTADSKLHLELKSDAANNIVRVLLK